MLFKTFFTNILKILIIFLFKSFSQKYINKFLCYFIYLSAEVTGWDFRA
jgi:hypothetical protein